MTTTVGLTRAEFITMMTGQPYPPVEDGEEYTKAWKEVEPSFNGSITSSQFRQLMSGLGEPVSDSEVESLLNNVDGEGKISCESNKNRKRCPVMLLTVQQVREFMHFVKSRDVENDILNDYQ